MLSILFPGPGTGEGRINQAFVIELADPGNPFFEFVRLALIRQLAVFIIPVTSAGDRGGQAEAGGKIAVGIGPGKAGGNGGEGDFIRFAIAGGIIFLEDYENIVPVIQGLGGFQFQLIQPVLTDDQRLGGCDSSGRRDSWE